MLAHVRLPLVLTLALTPLAGAQEAVQDGERWRTSMRVVSSEVPVGEADAHADTTTIAWTESSQVVLRPHGFALRSSLTSYSLEQAGLNARASVAYDAADLQRLGLADAWSLELDPTWRVLDACGRHVLGEARRAALLEARGDEEGGERDGCVFRAWFGRRGAGRDGGWHVRMTNDHLLPVRVTLARIHGGANVDESFAARFEGAGFLPGGEVRFAGAGDGGRTFRVTFDVQGTDLPAPSYSFALDEANRLTRLAATGSWVKDGVRRTRDYAWALEEVLPPGQGPELSPGQPAPGIDASDAPRNIGEASSPDDAPTPQAGGEVGQERDGAEQPGSGPQRQY